MYGYIYITTNLINGRKYIGKKVSPEFDIKYKGSGTALKLAFQKYGFENFETHILEEINSIPTICNNNEELNNSEYYYIKYYNAVQSKEYYNLKAGGEGGGAPGLICITSPDDNTHKRVLPIDLENFLNQGWYEKGPIPSEETKNKRAKSNTGKKRSKETRLKQSISAKISHKPVKPENQKAWREKLSKISTGRGRKIMCNETGEIFNSLKAAANKYNTTNSSICYQIKGKYKTAGGHTFSYITEN